LLGRMVADSIPMMASPGQSSSLLGIMIKVGIVHALLQMGRSLLLQRMVVDFIPMMASPGQSSSLLGTRIKAGIV